MTKASELEQLHRKYENLKEKEAKIKGGIDTILSQLKKLKIDSIQEAKNFIAKKEKEKEKDLKEYNKLLAQIKTLLN